MKKIKVQEKLIAILKNEDGLSDSERLDMFNELLAQEPDKSDVEQHPVTETDHIPISKLEHRLDTFFKGEWSTTGFAWNIVKDKLLGHIVLTVINPITGNKISRTGSAAVPFSNSSSYKFKGRNYTFDIELSLPALISECTKNACKKIGKYFGRDLNRMIQDNYMSFVKTSFDSGSKEFIVLAKKATDFNQKGILKENSKSLIDEAKKTLKEKEEVAKLNELIMDLLI